MEREEKKEPPNLRNITYQNQTRPVLGPDQTAPKEKKVPTSSWPYLTLQVALHGSSPAPVAHEPPPPLPCAPALTLHYLLYIANKKKFPILARGVWNKRERERDFLITSLPSIISCFPSSKFLSSLTILLLIPILSPSPPQRRIALVSLHLCHSTFSPLHLSALLASIH